MILLIKCRPSWWERVKPYSPNQTLVPLSSLNPTVCYMKIDNFNVDHMWLIIVKDVPLVSLGHTLVLVTMYDVWLQCMLHTH